MPQAPAQLEPQAPAQPPSGDSGLGRRAIGWALLGQAIWLPLLLIAAHDRWLAPQFRSAAPSQGQEGQASGTAPPRSLGDVVQAAALPPSGLAGESAAASLAAAAESSALASGRPGLVLRSSAGSAPRQIPSAMNRADQSSTPATAPAVAVRPVRPTPAPSLSIPEPPPSPRRRASLSQLLGGSMGLQELPAAMLQPGRAPSEAATDSPAGPPPAPVRP